MFGASVNEQVKGHATSPLVEEKHVGNDHGHETFIGRSTQTRDDTSTQEAGVRGDEGLPDICQDAHNGANDEDGATTKDIGRGHNEKVGIAQRNGCHAKEQVHLGQRLAELVLKNDRERRDGQWRHDGDEGEEELVAQDYGLPCCAPVLFPTVSLTCRQ
jgi:hypothetical protein